MRFSRRSAFVGIFFFFFFFGSGFAQKDPYPFTKEATAAPAEEYFDYIIVGGGTAACALGTTLSASAKVLILERGGLPYGNAIIATIDGYVLLQADPSPSSALQRFISKDGVFLQRARVLGGGTSVNGGFYSRASAEFVSQAGWDRELVEESYEWVEKELVSWPQVRQWQSAVREGLSEAGVVPDRGFTYEHLVGTKVGGSTFDENGTRHTAADLLKLADATKISVYVSATVQKVVFRTSSGQKPKAYGVVYEDSEGSTHTAYLNEGPQNEIILSAGALGSPHLLMLSGIGPAEELEAQDIQVILDQPSVGRNMVDNPYNVLLIPSRRPVETSLMQVTGITPGNIVASASGFFDLASIPRIAELFADSADQNLPSFTIPTVKSIIGAANSSGLFPSTNIQAGALVEKVTKPFSIGQINLRSSDANDNPRVTFNYFQDSRDVESCVRGMEIVKRVVESEALSSFQHRFASFESYMALMLAIPVNLRKRHLSSLHSLKQFCVDTVTSSLHYHGGCHVGRVVDSDYKVIGVDALRVIDASTFNESPGTNPQATVMMLGRYMGQKILQERAAS